MNVHFIDTSVFVEILNVPKMNSHHDIVMKELKMKHRLFPESGYGVWIRIYNRTMSGYISGKEEMDNNYNRMWEDNFGFVKFFV